jgi:hypothetical protein
MKNYKILLFFLFSSIVSCIAQNNDKNAQEIKEVDYSEYWGTDSIFQEKLNAKGLFPFENKDKVGFKDKSGKIIIDAIYDIIPGVKNGQTFGETYDIHLFDFLEENTLLVGIQKNQNDEDLNKPEFLSLCAEEYFFGLININGKVLIEPSFQLIAHPDIYSQPVIYIEESLLGIYFPKQNKENIFLNAKGEIFDLSVYSFVKAIDNNLFRIEKNEKFGIVTKQGEPKVPIGYDGIQVNSNLIFNDNRLIQVCNGCQFYDEGRMGSGDTFFDLFVKGKHGLIDENGKIIIPLAYESIVSSNKVAFVNKGGKVTKFNDEDLFVGGQWEIYDPNSNKFSKTNYKTLIPLISELFMVSVGEQTSWNEFTSKVGLINEDGKEILSMKYTNISVMNDNEIIGYIGEIQEIFIWDGKELTKIQ